jgi:hypothetical protein
MSLSKKSKTIITVLFIGAVVTLFAVTKIIYAPHEKTEDLEAVYKGKGSDFISSIGTDTTLTAGIIIEISGEVTSLEDSAATINGNIFCQFSNQKITLKTGEIALVKGRFIGYDDLMEEVKLDKCILKKYTND